MSLPKRGGLPQPVISCSGRVLTEFLMFNKSNPEGYKKMLEGVELKAPVHGERTMLTTVRCVKGAVVPVLQHPL